MRRYKQRHIQSISSGYFARDESETDYAVAVGRRAGYESQGTFATAIGDLAGETSQGENAVALGSKAGQNSQGTFAIAIGDRAGFNSQSTNAIAIGIKAGHGTQGADGIAIGTSAGETKQGANAIAIGATAGQTSQGAKSIAIDTSAGTANQPANSIIVNASATAIVNPKTLSLYVAPVRETAKDSNILVYGADKEVNRGFPRLPVYENDIQATQALLGSNNIQGYSITGFKILSGGTGYKSGQVKVTIGLPSEGQNSVQASAGEITVIDGVITNIEIENPGAGYISAPSVTITEIVIPGQISSGPASGAQAIALINEKNGYLYFDSTLTAVKVYFNGQWLKLSTA